MEYPGIQRSLLPRDVILASEPGGDSAGDSHPCGPGFSGPVPTSSGTGGGKSSKWLQVASFHALMCAWAQPELKGQRLP